MDDDTFDLIIQLASRVGTLMEDASPIALLLAAQPEAQLGTAIETISRALREIAVLVPAIETLTAELS